MDSREKFEYWQDIALYDLETAQTMYETKNILEKSREAFIWLQKLKP